MRKCVLAICVLVIVIGKLFFIQHQSQAALRQQNEFLQQQLELLQNYNTHLSNSLAQKQSAAPADDQSRELARLRNQVGMLRQRTNELGIAQQPMHGNHPSTTAASSQTEPMPPEDQFQLDQEHRISALRQMILAMYGFTNSKNDRFPTNFDQLTNMLDGTTNFEGGIPLDSFEFMNTGLTRISTPDLLIFREKTPRQSADGKWVRIYGFGDGSVQVRGSPDGNFDDYEKAHSPPPPQ